MDSFDVAIIGGGIMGASTALAATRRGLRVVLIDQATLPNPRGASVDHSKVFRYSYPDPLYVRLAAAAREGWHELERASGRELLVPTGVLLLGEGEAEFEHACVNAIHACGHPADTVSAEDAARRWPQFTTEGLGALVWDPAGALVRAEDAVRVTLDLARRAGVQIREGERVRALADRGIELERGERIASARTLIAGGPWTRQLRPEFADRLRVTRQEVLYFEPRAPDPFLPARFPIFLHLASGFYGFPVHHGRAMKLACHLKGPPADPDHVHPAIADEPAAREFFRRIIPGLADARLVETRVCHYNNTPDDDFIIDWLPGRSDVLVATGFSGHGFKFGPAIGAMCADLLATGRCSFPIERFALRRFDVGRA